MQKKLIIGVTLLVVGIGIFLVFRNRAPKTENQTPTPTPGIAQQLTPDQYPKVSLDFSSEAHYATVNITNIHADQVEYELQYDATIKGNTIQSGVSASAKLDGKTDYSYKQLLGSESSGKFTYHTKIVNAEIRLTLRDNENRSVYNTTLPFTVSPGKSVDLTPNG